MKKRKVNFLVIFFASVIPLFTASIIMILVFPLDNKFEAILGLSSLLLTLALGVITYYQTNKQTQIDMLDKTPYFRIVKNTDYSEHFSSEDTDTNALYEYTKFLRYSPISSLESNNKTEEKKEITEETKEVVELLQSLGDVVHLQFENISSCTIKRVTKYICQGEKYTDGGAFVPYNETKMATVCNRLKKIHDAPDASEKVQTEATYYNNFNLNQREFDLVSNETFEVAVCLSENVKKNDRNQQLDFSIALEIETVHGYVYTQYMVFSVTPVPVQTAEDWVYISDYDVDIVPGKIRKKYLKSN